VKPSEFAQYWQPARQKLGEGLGGSERVAELLGIKYVGPMHWTKLELTDEHRHKLDMINGPYGDVIVKMMEVRKEQND
jgi:hypothetical protein